MGLYLTYSGRVQYRGFLRVLRLKACPLSAKVSYQKAQGFFNMVEIKIPQDLTLKSLYFMLNSLLLCA